MGDWDWALPAGWGRAADEGKKETEAAVAEATAKAKIEKYKPKVTAYFQSVLGRPATQGEIDNWARSMELYGEDVLDQYMRNSPEAKKYAQQQETDKVKQAYDSRAPIRANMYSSLAGNVNQATQAGNTALYHNLAQRGLLDSGSLGAGTTKLGINAQNAMGQGATAIQNEDYASALASGQNLTNWNNQMYAQQLAYNQQNAHENQKYAYMQSQQNQQPDFWTQLMGNVAGGVGKGAGEYLAAMLF